MNTSRKLLMATVAVAAASAVASSAFAQSSATANGTASVTILTPLTVAVGGAGSELAFGKVVKGSGDVTINATSAAVGGSLTKVGTGLTKRAEFVFTGEGGQAVNITVPASVSLSNGTTTKSASLTHTVGGTNVSADGNAVATTFSGSLGSSGTVDVGIGGSLTLAGSETTGAYSGSFTVTAVYN